MKTYIKYQIAKTALNFIISFILVALMFLVAIGEGKIVI